MTLDADEFMRRFLMHVLPKGFRRIRHFGFLANLLPSKARPHPRYPRRSQSQAARQTQRYRERCVLLTGKRLDICPCCGGRMVDVDPRQRPRPTSKATM